MPLGVWLVIPRQEERIVGFLRLVMFFCGEVSGRGLGCGECILGGQENEAIRKVVGGAMSLAQAE